MANRLKIGVVNPDDLLATNEYGTGALISVERSTVGGTGYAVLGTVALLAGITSYRYDDSTGIDTSWYRTRYSNAGSTSFSSYSAEFQATAIRPDYAMLDDAKLRLGIPDTDVTNDAVLQTFCDQVNRWIESYTGRVLRPIPAVSTTITAGGTLASTSITLASAVNISAGDTLMLGPVAGTHEHTTVAAVTGVVLTLQSGLAVAYANGTAVVRCLLFDGDSVLENGRLLMQANGIVSATALEVAFYTGGTYNLIPATDWFLRPLPMDREPGWPATELWMTDIPTATNSAPRFNRGYGTTRLSGVALGWPAIPSEIIGLALTVVISMYRARGAGGSDMMTIGSDGSRTFERLLGTQDYRTLQRYRDKQPSII